MTVLCLPADMGTAFAKHFLEQLRKQATDIVLDGGAVKRLGGRCFEILLAAQKTAHERQTCFSIQNPSVEFKKALELLGGTFLLGKENNQ
ncbi:STAS domain-containing protein [Gluconobacter cerinus]|uniref:STAS domain-containing protein n=1 Tax=Gluconobacter cerinus TaxID=38307 RepID=UPI00193F794A|nr:STAS domain-containing protein [Gluconobacter cerinus]MBM3097989.1 STAS domain-containing protein [Gluconobacter cerinus]